MNKEIKKKFEERITLLYKAEGAPQSTIDVVLRKDENLCYRDTNTGRRLSDYTAGYEAAIASTKEDSRSAKEAFNELIKNRNVLNQLN